eukprot:COSAG02_NODE_4262_length_5575_cov_7.055698_6_plen_150_part_00
MGTTRGRNTRCSERCEREDGESLFTMTAVAAPIYRDHKRSHLAVLSSGHGYIATARSISCSTSTFQKSLPSLTPSDLPTRNLFGKVKMIRIRSLCCACLGSNSLHVTHHFLGLYLSLPCSAASQKSILVLQTHSVDTTWVISLTDQSST